MVVGNHVLQNRIIVAGRVGLVRKGFIEDRGGVHATVEIVSLATLVSARSHGALLDLHWSLILNALRRKGCTSTHHRARGLSVSLVVQRDRTVATVIRQNGPEDLVVVDLAAGRRRAGRLSGSTWKCLSIDLIIGLAAAKVPRLTLLAPASVKSALLKRLWRRVRTGGHESSI